MIITKQLIPAILLSAAAAFLSACGGGGSAGETNNSFTNPNNTNTNTKPQSSSASLLESSSSASTKSTSSISSAPTKSSSSARSISGGADITPPTTPNTLEVVSAFSDVVFLSWGKATDNVAVVAYKVFRDGIQIAEIEELENYYADYSVAAGKTYLYEVSAGDAVGNWSSIVAAKAVTPSASHSSSSNSTSSVPSSKASSSSTNSTSSSKASSSAVAIGVSFQWQRPLFRENGSDIFEHEIARYEIRYKLPNETNFITELAMSPMVSKTLPNVPRNAYFEIATVDVNGAYSRFIPIQPL